MKSKFSGCSTRGLYSSPGQAKILPSALCLMRNDAHVVRAFIVTWHKAQEHRRPNMNNVRELRGKKLWGRRNTVSIPEIACRKLAYQMNICLTYNLKIPVQVKTIYYPSRYGVHEITLSIGSLTRRISTQSLTSQALSTSRFNSPQWQRLYLANTLRK